MKLIITGACGHIGSYIAENVFKIPKIKKCAPLFARTSLRPIYQK